MEKSRKCKIKIRIVELFCDKCEEDCVPSMMKEDVNDRPALTHGIELNPEIDYLCEWCGHRIATRTMYPYRQTTYDGKIVDTEVFTSDEYQTKALIKENEHIINWAQMLSGVRR